MVRHALLAALALSVPLAHADTYKWVDAKGVVNYSNTPPPSAARAQPVEDRISVYTADAPLNRAAEVNRRLDAMEAEWLQRQWLMAMSAAPAAPAPDYRAGSYLPAVAFVPLRRPVQLNRPVTFPASLPPAPHPVRQLRAPRATRF